MILPIFILCSSFASIQPMYVKNGIPIDYLYVDLNQPTHITQTNIQQPIRRGTNHHHGNPINCGMPPRPLETHKNIHQLFEEKNPQSNGEIAKILKEARYQEPPTQIDSVPLFSLTETIEDITNKSKEENNQQLLIEKTKIEQQLSKKIFFGKTTLESKQFFIEKFLDGSIAHLLQYIENAPPSIAIQYFKKLCTLWPWEPKKGLFWGKKISFLSDESITSEQQIFIDTLGCDVMRNAEMCLMSRQDVLCYLNKKNCGSIKTAYKNYQKLQKMGQREILIKEKHILEETLVTGQNADNYPLLKANLAILNDILSNPATFIFYNIKHADLSSARTELIFLEQQIMEQLKEQNIIHMSDAQGYLESIYGCDVLAVAHDLYRSRPDFTYSPENQSLLSNTLQVILDNIEHLPLLKAHTELVNFKDQINQQFAEENITDEASRKEYLAQVYEGDVLSQAQQIYTSKPEHQYIVKNFVPIDLTKVTINIVKQSPDCTSISQHFLGIADQVCNNAQLCQIEFLSDTKQPLYTSIHAIKNPHDTFDFVCNLTAVDHTLHSLQQQSEDIVAGTQTPARDSTPLLEASSTLCNKKLEEQIPFVEQMEELQHQHELYKHLYHMRGQCAPLLCHAIERRMNALDTIKHGNIPFVTKAYDLKNSAQALLCEHKHDTIPFMSFTGNEYQHVLHTESLEIIDAINQLNRESRMYDCRGALVDYAAAVCEYNQDGLTHKATQVADLCWILLDYGSAVAEGAAIGVKHVLTDMIEHPVQTATVAFAGEYVLAYQVCKVACDVAGIGITALTDTTKAKNDWNDYIAPINQFIDTIKDEKMTLRQAIQSGTAIAVGWRAQNKVLGGMGKLCKNVKAKAIKFTQENPLVKPQDYMVTPEGILFKATHESTCPPSCVNQGEKLHKSLKTTEATLQRALLIEQFNKVIKTTKHGLERLLERNFTPEEVKILYKYPDITKLQNDGAKVFVKEVNYKKYNVMIYNLETTEVITAMKSVSLKDLTNLGKKYGWTL